MSRVGRPPWVPDATALRTIYRLAASGATVEAIGAAMGVAGRTIRRREKVDPALAVVLAAGRDRYAIVRTERHAHGSSRRYALGCRCDECRRGCAARKRAARRRRAATVPPERVPHGLNGYANYDCRCPVCRAAQQDANRRYYQRRRAS